MVSATEKDPLSEAGHGDSDSEKLPFVQLRRQTLYTPSFGKHACSAPEMVTSNLSIVKDMEYRGLV